MNLAWNVLAGSTSKATLRLVALFCVLAAFIAYRAFHFFKEETKTKGKKIAFYALFGTLAAVIVVGLSFGLLGAICYGKKAGSGGFYRLYDGMRGYLSSPSATIWFWAIIGVFVAEVAVLCIVELLYKKKKTTSKNPVNKHVMTVLANVFVVFSVYAVTLIYPFVWMFMNSLKDKFFVITDPFGMPKEVIWSNYTQAFEEYNIAEMFFNTITLTVGGVLVGTLATTLAAYTMAKFKFFGKDVFFNIIIISMTIPTVGSIAGSYKLMIDTQLFGTYLGMVLMYAGAFSGHFLFVYAFFKGISWEYAESAMIDGASNFQIFLHIMIPIAKPMLLTIIILKTLSLWNDYWSPYLFYSNHPTLAVGMHSLQQSATHDGEFSKLFAAMIIGTLPIIGFFLVCQKPLMSVTIGGGIKG